MLKIYFLFLILLNLFQINYAYQISLTNNISVSPGSYVFMNYSSIPLPDEPDIDYVNNANMGIYITMVNYIFAHILLAITDKLL